MNRRDFDAILSIVVESQGWRTLGPVLQDLWFNTASPLTSEEFSRLAMTFADAANQKPADFFRELKGVVRRATPAAPVRPVEASPTCDEAIRCRKALAAAQRARTEGCAYGGCKSGGDYGQHHCYCFAEAWAEPITAEDRKAPAVNAVAAVLGGVPAPDPKEGDLVWR